MACYCLTLVFVVRRIEDGGVTRSQGSNPQNINTQASASFSDNPRPRVKFLLGIFTMDKPFDRTRRDAIRKTYLKFYDSAYLVVKERDQNRNRICSLQDLQKGKVDLHDCQIAYTFVVGANPDGPTDLVETYYHQYQSNNSSSYDPPPPPLGVLLVEHPISQSGDTLEEDVTYLNMKENMNQGKTPSWFQYATTVMNDYPFEFDYIGKLDTDTLLYTPKFMEMVEQTLEPYPRNTRVYGGTELLQTPCEPAVIVPPSVIVEDDCKPPNAATYMSGQFYFLSPDLVKYVTSKDELDTRNELRVIDEDYSMGRWVHSHPLPIHSVSFRQAWAHNNELKYPKEFTKQWKQFQYWWFVKGKRGAYATAE
jgi:hypothetical protein